jgi:signal transduction histidine kinase
MARTAPEPLKERLDASCDLIGRAVVEVRRILADLSPAVLEQLGLAAAVRRLLSRFEEQYGIEVRADLAGLGAVEKGTATVVYRLVQECCNNVAKHSSASRLNVWLRTDDRTLRMRLEDDGAGFKVEDALSKRDSFGLAGMQERVTLCGGTLRIDSRPGRGTRILAELPIEPARPRTGKESYAEDQTAVGR